MIIAGAASILSFAALSSGNYKPSLMQLNHESFTK